MATIAKLLLLFVFVFGLPQPPVKEKPKTTKCIVKVSQIQRANMLKYNNCVFVK